jgi:hypothetical protein
MLDLSGRVSIYITHQLCPAIAQVLLHETQQRAIETDVIGTAAFRGLVLVC